MSLLTLACAETLRLSRDASQHAVHCEFATDTKESVSVVYVEYVLLTVYSVKETCPLSVGETRRRAQDGLRTAIRA